MTTPPAPASILNRPDGPTKPPEQGLKCPRCDSHNTKFCYYNNYSLSQPRHFCKTCRRYWTKGGALRNVPFGGGSRKNRKSRSAASLSSASAPPFFHFGGYNAYSSASISSSPLVILDCQAPAVPFFNKSAGATTTCEENTRSAQRSLATSIESLSSINQDLHWKLQQKRLAMLFPCEGLHPDSSRRHDSSSLAFSGFKEISDPTTHGGGATARFLETSAHQTTTAYAAAVEENNFEAAAAAADWTGTWSQVHKFGGLQ